jgi:beta-N-acetylhexosaminidase
MNRIKDQLAQSFVVGISGTSPTPDELALFSGHGLGGVILFAENIEGPRQVWELNRALSQAALDAGRPPLFIMLDQEGGSVARLKEPFTHGPDMAELGASGDSDALYRHGLRMGTELVAAGFNWDLAPVVDVHAMEQGVMARRSLGGDPELVSRLAAAFIGGMHEAGCLTCAKHFPGLGRTTLDTHTGRPLVEWSLKELERVELPPFKAVAKAGVNGIMVCHAVFSALDPDNPASLSAKVIGQRLRQGLGFEGCVLTDDLEMGALTASLEPDKAAVRAYEAGNDLLLLCHQPEAALRALDSLTKRAEQGRISEQRIQKTAARIAALKKNLPPGPPRIARLQYLVTFS